MENYSAIAIVLIPAGIAWYWLYRSRKKEAAYYVAVLQKTATLQEYLERHSDCQTAYGIKCASCHSSQIKNQGLRHGGDGSRIFICAQCTTRLFKVLA